ncbi:RagB/SusD family nutrient uptake outer membrane protein [Chitinophaga sp. 212800010-3]|uniref:RagB/SusD family nutrient uptake outer membrane protein n=1 Tax=Bacteroidota TaxID=976 RepID=UPI001AC8CCDD|nr:RagB/SusD family nutrient uptake outer membrane protein [Chitinophaga sp. 212800010-3]MBN8880601.1 RagB/SusD family nutrient uptake outer membrane protein [Sphingobacteriales bacterium]MBN9484360.1 RagB/SusD family nutrient uptake outer membrane protein [Bacteroidota bacterium]MEC5143550.1 TPR-REGION domain-containing protein [Chitinophaga sp. 212800010-3]
MKKNTPILALMLLLIILSSGCKKFLEEKSDDKLAIPTTLKDFQALVNNWETLNSNFCSAGEASTIDYFLKDEDYDGFYYESDKRLYTWQPDFVTKPLSSAGDEWYYCYSAIYVCNSVLKGIEDNYLTGNIADNLKGQALVFRASRFLDAVLIWAPVYYKQTANTDLGMVLRLDPDMNIPSVRSSVQETYDRILKDLNDALPLLPNTSAAATLPTKAAAYGLLARTHLIMGNYADALENAEKAFAFNSQLIDFNGLDPNADFPIPSINQLSSEVIFQTSMFPTDLNNLDMARISPALYDLYNDRDLRKTIYFRKGDDGDYRFKGTHMGYAGLITGITTNELLLIIAECNARLDKLADAANALNKLLIKRWDVAQFTPYSFTNKDTALNTILAERRKELVFRGLRWSDIKRLNRDGFNITLTRTVNGQTITLPPNDLRYAIAIPETIIEVGGIQQNPR